MRELLSQGKGSERGGETRVDKERTGLSKGPRGFQAENVNENDSKGSAIKPAREGGQRGKIEWRAAGNEHDETDGGRKKKTQPGGETWDR